MKKLLFLLAAIVLTGCSRANPEESFENAVGQPRTEYSSDREAVGGPETDVPAGEDLPEEEVPAEAASQAATAAAEETAALPEYRMARISEHEQDGGKVFALTVEFTEPGYYCPVSEDSVMLINKQTGKEICPFGYSGKDQSKAIYLGWLCGEDDCPQKDRYSIYRYPYLSDRCRYTIVLKTGDTSLKLDDIRVRFNRLIFQKSEAAFDYISCPVLDCDYNTDTGHLSPAPALCHGQDLLQLGDDWFLIAPYGARQEDTRSFRLLRAVPLTGGKPDISMISDRKALSQSGSSLDAPEGCHIFRELSKDKADDGSFLILFGFESEEGELLPEAAVSAGIRACPVLVSGDRETAYIN